MPIQYVGFENGKYLILEGDPGVRLNFEGPDAGKFAQVNVPDNPTQAVPFSLTLRECAKLGFIPQLKESLTLSDPRITASELTGPSDDPRQNGALEFALAMSLHEMAHLLLGKNTKDNRLADRIYQVIKTSVIDLAKEEPRITDHHFCMAIWKFLVEAMTSVAPTHSGPRSENRQHE